MRFVCLRGDCGVQLRFWIHNTAYYIELRLFLKEPRQRMYVLAHALATSLVLRLNSLMLGTTDVHVRSETLLRKSLTA